MNVVPESVSESVKSSNFHILINTNQQYKNQDAAKNGVRCLYTALNTDLL